MKIGKDDAVMFKAQSGEVIVVFEKSMISNPLYSPDGEKFFELKQTGFGGSTSEYSMHFEDPHHGRKGQFKRKGHILTWDDKTFERVSYTETDLYVVPLPTVRKPEYLFRTKDKVFLYVSADKYDYSDESFKLFVGEGPQLKEVKVKEVERFLDGGTTNIDTVDGVLHSPTLFEDEAEATWKGQPIIRLDPDDYRIVESEKGVLIEKRTGSKQESSSVEPIGPDEVVTKKAEAMPSAVLEAFNTMIVQKWNGWEATFTQDELVALMVTKGLNKNEIFDKHWLEVEPLYEKKGWSVEYDKPGYNESYDANFTFKKKRSR